MQTNFRQTGHLNSCEDGNETKRNIMWGSRSIFINDQERWNIVLQKFLDRDFFFVLGTVQGRQEVEHE